MNIPHATFLLAIVISLVTIGVKLDNIKEAIEGCKQSLQQCPCGDKK